MKWLKWFSNDNVNTDLKAEQYLRALSYREDLTSDEVAHDFVGGVIKYYHAYGDEISKSPFFELHYEGASGNSYTEQVMHTNTLHLFCLLHRLGIKPKI